MWTRTPVPPLTPGNELHQRQVLSQLEEVQAAFVNLWRPRWNACQDVSASDWARITAFAQAHMRPIPFVLPPLDSSRWRNTLKRYKPTTARGVDGMSHLDLLHLPSSLETHVLTLLERVEHGEPWPNKLCSEWYRHWQRLMAPMRSLLSVLLLS